MKSNGILSALISFFFRFWQEVERSRLLIANSLNSHGTELDMVVATKDFFMFRNIVTITDYGHPMKAWIKHIWKIGPIWQTKYASAVPKNLGLGLNFGRAVKTISSLGVRSPRSQWLNLWDFKFKWTVLKCHYNSGTWIAHQIMNACGLRTLYFFLHLEV